MKKNISLEKLERDIPLEGFSARTNNSDEMAGKGVLPQLWEQLMADQLGFSSAVYGVYHQYQGDHSGEYTATVGREAITGKEVLIPQGEYLVFVAEENSIAAVQDLWQQVWMYPFKDNRWKRTYQCDFEVYHGESCKVYVGVEALS